MSAHDPKQTSLARTNPYFKLIIIVRRTSSGRNCASALGRRTQDANAVDDPDTLRNVT